MTIIEYVQKYVDAAIDTSASLPFATQEETIDKGRIITALHQVEQKAYYLTKGLVEVSLLKDGQERILDFILPNNFFCAYTSFLTQTPSDVQITALTPCQMSVIRWNELQAAYHTSLLANQLGRYVTEQLYIKKNQREIDFLMKSAEQRYRALMAQRPDLIVECRFIRLPSI